MNIWYAGLQLAIYSYLMKTVYLLLPKSTRKALFSCLWYTRAACTREQDAWSIQKSFICGFRPNR